MLTIRDPHGRVVCYLDGDDGVPRDQSGKPVGRRAGSDDEHTRLATFAARCLYNSGRTLMDLSPADVRQPGTETDFGIPKQMEYIADIASPIRFVKKLTGYWYTENVGDGIQLVVGTANPTGQQSEINPQFTATQFTTVGYALAMKLPRRVLANADFNLRKRAVRLLIDALRRGREYRVAKQLTTSTNFATGNRVAAAAKWNLGASASPLVDLFSALLKSYLPADTLVLPENASQYFPFVTGATPGPQIRDFVQGGGQLPRILVARAKMLYNKSPAYVWMPAGTGDVPLIRTTTHDGRFYEHWKKTAGPEEYERDPDWMPNDPEADIGTAATLRWVGDGGPGGSRVDGVLVRMFDDDHDVDTSWITVAVNDIEIVVSNQVGAIITGALA